MIRGSIAAAAFVLAFESRAFADAAVMEAYPVCASQPSKADSEAAHDAYIKGTAALEEADYASAVRQLRESIQRDCRKIAILETLSRAYEFNGDRSAAINALSTYVERMPADVPGADAVRKRLANLKARDGASGATPIEVKPSNAKSAGDVQLSTSTNVAPWILLGAGGAFVVSGSAIFAVGVTDSCSDSQRPNTLIAVGLVGAGIGAVALVTGIAWILSEGSPRSAGALQVTPVVSPTARGLALSGAF